jgi:hypothetical protein
VGLNYDVLLSPELGLAQIDGMDQHLGAISRSVILIFEALLLLRGMLASICKFKSTESWHLVNNVHRSRFLNHDIRGPCLTTASNSLRILHRTTECEQIYKDSIIHD